MLKMFPCVYANYGGMKGETHLPCAAVVEIIGTHVCSCIFHIHTYIYNRVSRLVLTSRLVLRVLWALYSQGVSSQICLACKHTESAVSTRLAHDSFLLAKSSAVIIPAAYSLYYWSPMAWRSRLISGACSGTLSLPCLHHHPGSSPRCQPEWDFRRLGF